MDCSISTSVSDSSCPVCQPSEAYPVVYEDPQTRPPRKSFWNTRCRCPYSYLSDDVLSHKIFPFLNLIDLAQATRVCTRWRYLTLYEPVLWRKINLAPYASRVTDDMLASLLQRYGTMVEDLRLCGCRQLSASLLAMVSSICPQLVELHCCGLNKLVSDDVVSSLLATAPSLKRLSLNGCTNVSVLSLPSPQSSFSKISLRGCIRITSHGLNFASPFLKELTLSGCKRITEDIGAVLANNCPQLEKLDLHGVRVDNGVVELISRGCPLLRDLDISSANPFGGSSALTDEILVSLARLSQLTRLNLQGVSKLTSQALIVFFSELSSLQHLNLGGCSNVCDETVSAICHFFPGLLSLNLSNCFLLTDQSLIAISRSLFQLESLDVHGCPRLAPTGVQSLLSLRSLTSLDISGCAGLRPSANAPLSPDSPRLADLLDVAPPSLAIVSY
eukprot:TRINITY_DN3819_c0_g1_i9.p1 TRINITY_DN3819_c0_g1~~TRINITY_DN3819_c0_g1_i9.p1  ORF type:complete len:445 (-),score=38.76 TRINITY_DN3819_c0_g1_i9:462-1796(-)